MTPEGWLHRLTKLRVDRARGDLAPHKPLLLLVVLELADQQLQPRDILQLSPELAFRFAAFWTIVAHRRRQPPDVRLPFHHLRSDGCWTALTEDGKPSPDSRLTKYAAMPADFVASLSDPCWRDLARRILIDTYFQPEERVALRALCGLPTLGDGDSDSRARAAAVQEFERRGREARFRMTVVMGYNYTCALTGYRLTTISAGSIVDAAHIHRFASSRNNDPRNGISLCKNAHWLFDQGLWSVTDDYRVIVAIGHFYESSPDNKGLESYNGALLRLPADRNLWPGPTYIAWHRKHKFLGPA